MKSIKVSNSFSGIESNGEVKILLRLTKESLKELEGKAFPEAYINEAIAFFDKRESLEDRLNEMQNELNSLKGGGQFFSSYQPAITKEDETIRTGIAEAEIAEVEDKVNIEKNVINKEMENDEEINKILLSGILDAFEDDDEEE